MNLARLGGVVAGAMLAVPLLSPVAANAAVQAPTSAAPATYASDCYYTHYWNGYWHRHVRLICDDDDYGYGGYYGGGFRGHDRGGFEHRGGFENRGGGHEWNNSGGHTGGHGHH